MNINPKFITILIWFCLTIQQNSYAQPNEDSILQIIKTTTDDSIKYLQFFTLVRQFKFNNLDKTKQYTDSIYNLYKKTDNEKYKGIADYYYGFYYRKLNEYEKAIHHYQESKKYGLESEYFSLYAVSISEIAGVYIDQGILDKALEINIEAVNFDEKATDHNRNPRLSNSYNSMGLIYGRMKEYENALLYYRKAIKIAANKENESIPAGNMAEIFMVQGIADSLLKYSTICHRLNKEINNPRGLAYSEWLQAEAYYMNQEYDLAEEAGLRSVALYKQYPEKILMTDAYYILSKALFKNKKIHDAVSTANKAIDISKEIDDASLITKGYGILSEIYEEANQFDKALANHKLYVEGLNKMDQLKNNDLLQDLSIKYDTAQKNQKIAEQKAEIALKSVQQNKLIGGLIILGLIPFFLYYRFKNKQKIDKQKLELLKKEKKLLAIDYMIQGQEEERKRIAQDLHDGLGGFLSSAKIQMKNIKQEGKEIQNLSLFNKAENLIDKAYQEVRRISHDMMPGALVDFGLFAAIEDLAMQINQLGKLKIQTYCTSTDSNIDKGKQSIIYRIIQEAIANTIKHAKAEKMLIQITSNDKAINLTIEDDGIGFNPTATHEGIGLKNIKSRVNYLNGKIDIISNPNEGSIYEIELSH